MLNKVKIGSLLRAKEMGTPTRQVLVLQESNVQIYKIWFNRLRFTVYSDPQQNWLSTVMGKTGEKKGKGGEKRKKKEHL